MVEYFSYLGHTVVGVEELPPTFHYLPAAAPPAELPALADCPREDARFVLERLYEADQEGRSLGREAILAAAREAGLPCSQQEVRRILAGLDRAGPVLPADGGGRSGNGLTNLTVFSFFDQFKRALLHLSAGWSWTARRVSFCYA